MSLLFHLHGIRNDAQDVGVEISSAADFEPGKVGITGTIKLPGSTEAPVPLRVCTGMNSALTFTFILMY